MALNRQALPGGDQEQDEEYSGEDETSSGEESTSESDGGDAQAQDADSIVSQLLKTVDTHDVKEILQHVDPKKHAAYRQYLNKLTPAELTRLKHILHHAADDMDPAKEKKDSAHNYVGTPARLLELLLCNYNGTLGGGVGLDTYGTVFRIWIAFEYAVLAGSNEDKPNNAAVINHLLYNNGDPADGLSPGGALVIGGAAASFFASLRFEIARIRHERHLHSFDYFRKRLFEVDPTKQLSDEELRDALHDFALRSKLSNHLSIIDDRKSDPAFQQQDKKAFRPNRFVRAINKIDDSKPATIIGKIYNTVNEYSYIFWLVCIPFILVLGVVAAFSPFFMPIIAGITLLIGAAYTTWKLVNYVKHRREKAKKHKASQQVELDEVAEEDDKDLDVTKPKPIVHTEKEIRHEAARQLHAAKVRLLMKTDHTVIMQRLSAPKKVPKVAIKKTDTEADIDLERYVLGTKHERRARLAITAIRGFAGGLCATIFILWFASTVLGALIVPALAAMGAASVAGALGTAAAFAGGSLFGTALGGLVGGVFGLKNTTQLHAKQLAYKQKVAAILNAPYKNSGMTKQEVFKRLLQQLEDKKAALKDNPNAATLLAQNGFDLKKELKKMDVFNDHYFESFKQKRTPWEHVKHFGVRAYSFITGSQNGIFQARYLLLAGGVFAGGVTALAIATGGSALIGFLVAAAVFAVVFGVLKAVEYHMARKQHHRERFVDTIDERNSFLVKKIKELDVMNNIANAPAPAVVSSAPVAQPATVKAKAPIVAGKKKADDFSIKDLFKVSFFKKPKKVASAAAVPAPAPVPVLVR
jgi:hypothetical protein